VTTFAEIYQEYMQSIDKPKLTDAEKKQAIMNAILVGVEIDGPPGSLEWYSRKLQEQMRRCIWLERQVSQLFWPRRKPNDAASMERN